MKFKLDQNKPLSLIQWFIKLRWVAISVFILLLIIAKIGFKLSFNIYPHLIVLIILIVLNISVKYIVQRNSKLTFTSSRQHNRLISIPIISDLILFSVVLHYSGSIENPLLAVYLLHIVMAAIILPFKVSLLITIIANVLFGILILLEYSKILPHNPPVGLKSFDLHQNLIFVLFTGGVFIVISFVLFYFTSSITNQLRSNQEELNKLKGNYINQKNDTNRYILKIIAKFRNKFDSIFSRTKYSNDSNLMEASAKKVDELKYLMDKLSMLTKLSLTNSLTKEKIIFRTLFINIINSLTETDMSNSAKEDITDNFYTASIVLKHSLNNDSQRIIHLTYTIEKKLKIIYANENLIFSLIFQLIHNAIKYNLNKGQVYFKARTLNKKLRIEIFDTGIGINKIEQLDIFDSFYRSTHHESENDGIGLTLVNEIVKIHEGKIWIDSKKGKGTKINLELPVLINEMEK